MKVIACETLKDELLLAMSRTGCSYPVIWVESGLHETPDKLRDTLQEILDGFESGTALMAFGFCGNSVVGLHTPRARLIMPRAADCIPLFLGSVERREQMGNTTYFFTGGYLNGERNMAVEYEHTLERYDPETAAWLMQEMMKHYEKFAVIDTGAFAVEPVKRKINPVAELLELPVETVPGDLGFFCELLRGPWPEERFLTVEPGGSITLEDSLNIGLSQV
jgi:hypothetical protein